MPVSPDEAAYLERRAEVQLDLAQRARSAPAVKAHYELATAYLERIHGDPSAAEPANDDRGGPDAATAG